MEESHMEIAKFTSGYSEMGDMNIRYFKKFAIISGFGCVRGLHLAKPKEKTILLHRTDMMVYCGFIPVKKRRRCNMIWRDTRL